MLVRATEEPGEVQTQRAVPVCSMDSEHAWGHTDVDLKGPSTAAYLIVSWREPDLQNTGWGLVSDDQQGVLCWKERNFWWDKSLRPWGLFVTAA